ncbi:MAG: hypothetical protein KAG89_18030 [Fulvimarina manganoxydans]|uniref:hypothetical protein n=1 Tax=Fulvimarina manganoxydans TaxID=937218 RepID=UPI001483A7B9|nr:hypothetical protein [Fulvimarina manganoxydans]
MIDPDTGRVEAVIELDDKSHDADRDRQRDAMLEAGDCRIVRFPSKPRPNLAIVRERTAFLTAAA